VHYAWNDLETARQSAEQSLPLAQQVDNVDTPALSWMLLACLALVQDNVEQAAARLAQAEQFVRQRNFPNRMPDVAAAQVRVLLRQGQLTAAAQLAEAHEIPLSRARVHLAHGDATAALAILESTHQQAAEKGWKDELLNTGILLALAYAALDDEKSALQHLSEALALAEPDGLLRAFLDEGRPMAKLLSEAARHGIHPAFTAKLLAAFKAEPDAPATTPSQPLIDPLSERELEILQLIDEGLSNREIGERLFLALDTIKGHNRKIFGKLQVKRRTEAVARARELGLL
jgi:LuxR family maltose regulon positive regulatory protein